MWQLNLLLFIQVFLGMIIVILLHRVGKLKAQVDEITAFVASVNTKAYYNSFIIEDEASSEADALNESMKPKEGKIGDATQSSLIQSVLGDFFP